MKSILSQFALKGTQDQAATDNNPAISVTAGAGSGKTRTLVARYLRLLEDGYPIRSLIAVTFTDKAAREMRSRVRSEIGKWLASPLLAEERAMMRVDWQAIFNALDSARISTIHSLCAEILRAHPAEARVDPGFSVLEEGLAAVFKAQAVELALIWAANDAQTAGLFGIFKEGELRRVLNTLLNQHLNITPRKTVPCPLQDWSAVIETWLTARLAAPTWKNSLADLANYQAQQPDDKLELSRQAVLAHWDEVSTAIKAQDWDAAFSGLAQLRKAVSSGGRKGNWSPADLECVRDAMGTLRDFYDAELTPLIGGFPPKVLWTLDQQAAEALPALYRLATRLLREYQQMKDEQQALDFDDLEGKAAQLLTENENIRTRWQHEIRAVLVDEFQDTNDRQRQIVYALSGFTPQLSTSVHSSRSSRLPVPQSVELFIVGDAKQSIYKFRGADVTVFRQVQADIVAAKGLPLDLDLTFRTHKPLLRTLNTLLSPILGEQDDPARPYQVPFAPMRAVRQVPRSEAINVPFVEFILGLGEDADTGRASAAAALAARLQQLRTQEGFGWGDMALLFRASTAFEIYEDALEVASIPFVTIAGRGFYDRPEIRDLLNALAAVADPTDDLALMGLLRSPAIGLSDADLYKLRYPNKDGKPLPFWEALRTADLSADVAGIKAYALETISELHALVGRVPAAQVIKRYLDLTGYRAMLGKVSGGVRFQRNVDKLLADAHSSRMVNLDDFLTYVQTLRDVGTREGEAPVEAGGGAVQLMTVHKAKGLEFPLVVIADAANQPPSWGSAVLIDDNLGLLPGLRTADSERPITWKLVRQMEIERDEAEDKRLLYVAATRAREKLLINGHVSRLKAGNLGLRGWLKRLGEVIGLSEVNLTGDVGVPQVLDLDLPADMGEMVCTLHPLPPADLSSTHTPARSLPQERSKSGALPDLAAPLRVPEERLLDEKIMAKEADPPPRVWRVVPRAKRPSGPAWVVGTLIHEAIRYWRFPDDDFQAFIRPFALEAGLTDPKEIRATVHTVERLLERLRAHSLWAEINAAERYHEVVYSIPGDRGIIDLLYRTQAGWVLVDFKTDELHSEAEMWEAIERGGYEEQVRRYAEAVMTQLGWRPRTLLVFLQIGASEIGLVEIE
jgi:ATP-dependent exoDNAse (exonuclease V) beta subunit